MATARFARKSTAGSTTPDSARQWSRISRPEHRGDVFDHYATWPCPAKISNDDASRVRLFEGDNTNPASIVEWYAPHIERWTEAATPATALFIERLIHAFKNAGDGVWEPFGGLASGSVAAVALTRSAYAAEREANIADMGHKRLGKAAANREVDAETEPLDEESE